MSFVTDLRTGSAVLAQRVLPVRASVPGEHARPVRSVWLGYSGVAAARFAAATSVRFDTPSLANTDETWWSTVFGEITSLMAMLALVRPSQSNSSTSCSR